MASRKTFVFVLLVAALATTVFSAPLPSKPSNYVTDSAGVIDAASRAQMESLLSELEQKTSAQVAVVTIDAIQQGDINNEANLLFKKWGIGQKGKNNGVLFLIAPNDRKMRIEVGYGLEGILPDGLTGRILDERVLPYFREGHMSQGILNGTLTVAGVIAQDAGVALTLSPVDAPQGQPREATAGEKIMALLFLVVFIYLIIRHPWLLLFLMNRGGRSGGGYSGGGFGGGFGGFGGGSSGGGGASRGW